MRLIRKGIDAALSGEWSRIYDYLYGQIVRPTARVADIGARYRGVPGETEWMSLREETDQFRPVLAEEDTTHTVTSTDQFDRIAFDLVNLRDATRIDISVRHLSDGTEIESETIRYRTGDFDKQAIIPIRLSSPPEANAVELSVTDVQTNSGVTDKWLSREIIRPRLSVPRRATNARPEAPPIFIISVDSLRYDRLDRFAPVLDALGDDAFAPAEPRTQGVSTWPAHASLFTGVHPHEHGCRSDAIGPEIARSLTTLGELLDAHGYRNSAVVSAGNLSPDLGYGRGFHRYDVQQMDWESRNHDIRTILQTATEWLSSDHGGGGDRLFYFLHSFDVHYPYIPPEPQLLDGDANFEVFDTYVEYARERDYVRLLTEDPFDVSDEDIDLMEAYYDECVDFVVRELRAFVETLKREGVFDQSLIVLLGDHGDDFYERNFLFHHSLYEQNIKPGVIVKPPTDWENPLPDDLDHVDIFPTIARCLGDEKAVQQAAGVPIQARDGSPRPRITERFLDTYNVSVETASAKTILTYENRADVLNGHPAYVESSVRDEPYAAVDSSDDLLAPEAECETIAREFVTDARDAAEQSGRGVTRDVEKRLEKLGYR